MTSQPLPANAHSQVYHRTFTDCPAPIAITFASTALANALIAIAIAPIAIAIAPNAIAIIPVVIAITPFVATYVAFAVPFMASENRAAALKLPFGASGTPFAAF